MTGVAFSTTFMRKSERELPLSERFTEYHIMVQNYLQAALVFKPTKNDLQRERLNVQSDTASLMLRFWKGVVRRIMYK